jgi:diguanylate cyclase (GGDEF)-like protein/PAS domain S-box-containing protein
MAAVSFLAAGICFAVAGVAVRRTTIVGYHELIWLMLAMGGWSLLNGLQPFMSDLALKITLNTWQYSMIISVPMLWLLVTRRAVGFDFMSWRHTTLLAIIPLSAIALAWTNTSHQLIWQTIEPVGDRLVFSYGFWFWVAVAYAYVLMLASLSILLRALWHPVRFRPQIYGMLLACCIPWLSNLLYLTEAIPIPGFDLTPIGFALSGLIAAWALIRQQVFDLIPIARDVLIDQMGDGVLVLDRQQRIVDYNPATMRICALARGMIGQPLASALPDLDTPIQQAIASSTTCQLGSYGPHAINLELRVTALQDRQGQPYGWLVVLRDINEQQELLHQLHSEHEFASQVMQSIGEGLTVTDAEGRFTFVNNAYARLFGYSPEDLIGRSPFELTVSEEFADLRSVLTKRQNGQSSTYLSSLRCADSKIVTVQITGSPRFEHGKFAGCVAVITDLSERISQEKALRTAEQTLRSFFDSVSVMMGIVELSEHDILHITDNLITANFFGTTVEAMLEQWASALGAPPHVIERWLWAYRESERHAVPVEFEYSHTLPHGSRWLAVTVCCIGVAESGRTRCAYVASDITQRKLMEQQILETQYQLEEANAQLRELARTDGLTGLHNRSAFDEYLTVELARMARLDIPLALLLIDLDHFKHYNDTYGHLAGDEVLRSVAQIFHLQMRRNDMAARYGGEEFALILPNTDTTEAGIVAERIRSSIEQMDLLGHTITASIGVAVCRVAQTPAQLIDQADTALYAAKRQGRNRVCHAPG